MATCQQASKAQTVLDLHVLRHPRLLVKHVLLLFDTLIKPIIIFGGEMWGMQRCDTINKFYIGFLKKLLRVKQSMNTCMVYTELGCETLFIHIRKNVIKYWLKVIYHVTMEN